MTISIQSTSKSTAGNGSVTQFPYDFKIFNETFLDKEVDVLFTNFG